MKKTFLIATVQDRTDGLQKLLLSSQMYRKTWAYVIVAQSYTDEDIHWLNTLVHDLGLDANIIYVDHGIGPGSAKYLGLLRFESDIWVSLDDDMELIPGRTKYNEMAEIISKRPDIAFISGNWAKTLQQAVKKEDSDKLVKQPIVYTGGGLMFRGEIAKLLLEQMPDKPWLFDDITWSMYGYINGYDNYRYLGSVAIHKVCTVGGRKSWVEQKKRTLPDQSLIRVRPAFNSKAQLAVDNCYCICLSSDLTDKAKELHKRNMEVRNAGRKKTEA